MTLFTTLILTAVTSLAAGEDAARLSHVTIWAMFDAEKSCADILAAKTIKPGDAAEQLMQAIVGDQMPDLHKLEQNGIYAAFWNNLRTDSAAPASGYDAMAARIYRIHHGVRGGADQTYSFAIAVRGEMAIKEYLERFQRSFDQAYALLDTKEELAQKNRQLDRRAWLDVGWIGAAAAASTAAGLSWGMDPTLSPFLMGASVFLFNQFSVPSKDRFLSYFLGDGRFRSVVGPFQTKVPATLHDRSSFFQRSEKIKGFYLEIPVAISAPALHALRNRTDQSLAELRRSSLVLSAGVGRDQHTAFLELLNIPALGFFSGMMKTVDDRLQNKQDHFLHFGRAAVAHFFEEETGEPIIVHWLQFDLSPDRSGGKRPRQVGAQKESEEMEWGAGTVPSR